MIYAKTIVTGLNKFYRGHFQNTPNIKTFFGYALIVVIVLVWFSGAWLLTQGFDEPFFEVSQIIFEAAVGGNALKLIPFSSTRLTTVITLTDFLPNFLSAIDDLSWHFFPT